VGGIELSHDLEATAIIWIITAYTGGHWNQCVQAVEDASQSYSGAMT